MIHRVIHTSIKHKYIVLALITAFLIAGIRELLRLPVDAVPDITNNQVQVITTAPALSTSDVERLITFPLEQALRTIPHLEEMRSFSRSGLSLITLVFPDETDIYWARQQIAEKLQQVREQIPPSAGVPYMAPVTTGLGEIYQYVLRPAPGYERRYDATALRTLQDWVVRRQLLGVEGVADVSSFGGRVLQYEITFRPDILRSSGLAPSDLVVALERNNQNAGGAYIEKSQRAFFIRSEGFYRNLDEVRQTVIGYNRDGTPLHIGDVADVRPGFALPYGALVFNDSLEVAGGVVMMLKGENGNRVVQRVKERVDQIRRTLPEGVILEPFLDRSKMVNSVLATVKTNLAEGALIVLAVLTLLLGSVRAGLLVASVIPLSFLFAVTLMNRFGISGNLMSLGALDFGLLVDGAVIVVEGVLHTLQTQTPLGALNKTGRRLFMDNVVREAAAPLLRSALFGQLIIIAVYIPVLSLQGIEGKMFRPMAWTVLFALAGAFLLSFTYVPALSALVLSLKDGKRSARSEHWLNPLIKLQQKVLQFAFRKPSVIFGAVFSVLILAGFAGSRLGGEFIPRLPEGDLAIETRLPTGSSLSLSMATVKSASALLLRNFPEIEKIVAKTGSGEIPTDPMPLEASDLMVILKDRSTWTSAHTWDEMILKVKSCLDSLPQVSFGIQYPVAMRFNELLTGARQDVVCKIFGENLDSLTAYANRLREMATGVEGISEIYQENILGASEIKVVPDRDQMARLGADISNLNNALETAFAGMTAGYLYDNERRHALVVRLDTAERGRLEAFRQLPVKLADGSVVPLGALASVRFNEAINQIQRENARRRIVVGFNVRGRDVESVVQDIRRHLAGLKLAPGYSVEFGGAYENLMTARRRLAVAVPLALAFILAFLYGAFRRWLPLAIIFITVPLSAVGGILALSLRHMPFSVSAGIGFIVLFGVAVLNGIVLVSEILRYLQENPRDVRLAALRASAVRLRPILVTALVAATGFLPMALSRGNGAEVQRPLATVVIGGLLLATFMTLIVLPLMFVKLYEFFNRKSATTARPTLLITGFLGLSLAFSGTAKAQKSLTESQALDSALQHSHLMRMASLNSGYFNTLARGGPDINQPTLELNIGQINSAYLDNGLGVRYTMPFPGSLVWEQRVLNARRAESSRLMHLRAAEVKLETLLQFYQLALLREKEKNLRQADSFLVAAIDLIARRVRKGESDPAELAFARLQRANITQQTEIVHKEIFTVQQAFTLITGLRDEYDPQLPSLRLEPPALPQSSAPPAEHPVLLWLNDKLLTSRAEEHFSRARLWPDLSVGILSLTIAGTGADNKYYDRRHRFTSVQLGVGLPLNFRYRTAQVQAARLQRLMAEERLRYENTALTLRLTTLARRLKDLKEHLDLMENDILPATTQLIALADKKLKSGALSGTDWALQIAGALQSRLTYLDHVMEWNKTVLELRYTLNQL